MNTVACRRKPSILLTLCAGAAFACAAPAPARAQYTFLRSFGSTGSGNGQFIHPSDIKIDSNGNVFVIDSGDVNSGTNNRVEQFTSEGAYVSQFGSAGDANGQFANPLGLAIDSNNNIFVADTNNDRVQKFNNSGQYQAQFGRLNNGTRLLSFPIGLAFDSSGSIFVVDNNTDSVQRFTVSGNTFTQAGQIGGSTGSANGQLNYPYGLAIDRNNNVFVVNSGNDRVEEYDSSGNFVRNFRTTDQFGRNFRPHDIAIDNSGNIFVTDFSNGFVARFNSSGQFLDRFGTKGSGAGQFSQAEGVAVDNSGNIYVSDFTNNRVSVFALAAPVPEAGTLLTLACMTAGGLYTTRRLKKIPPYQACRPDCQQVVQTNVRVPRKFSNVIPHSAVYYLMD